MNSIFISRAIYSVMNMVMQIACSSHRCIILELPSMCFVRRSHAKHRQPLLGDQQIGLNTSSRGRTTLLALTIKSYTGRMFGTKLSVSRLSTRPQAPPASNRHRGHFIFPVRSASTTGIGHGLQVRIINVHKIFRYEETRAKQPVDPCQPCITPITPLPVCAVKGLWRNSFPPCRNIDMASGTSPMLQAWTSSAVTEASGLSLLLMLDFDPE